MGTPLTEAKAFTLLIRERLHILQLLPNSGNYKELCSLKGIVEKCKFSPTDMQEFGLVQTPQGLQTNPEFDDTTFEIDFSEEEQDIIRTALEKLDKTASLELGNMELFKMFCEEQVTE